MERRIAKEFFHMQGWLDRVDEIVSRGEKVYWASALLQEAGDSLMMKLGEACKRLSQPRSTGAGRCRMGACRR